MRTSRACIAAGSVMLMVLGGCGSKESSPPAADPASQRRTTSGPVVGFAGEYGSHVWLGLPFAAPPVGARRWRVPQPPPSWTDTRAALARGSACVQYTSPFGGVQGREGTAVGSEDCLYLNVYAPRFAEADVPKGTARLPVMLWIHGGGNSIGEAGFYNGGNLAAHERVVVITTNYRLGPFGWFRHAALRPDGTDALDQSGNFGTLDLVRALEWIRENAATFGGDPGNVTIFGESAGGTNVFSLLLAPQARGLFHRAIVQSGGLRLRDTSEGEAFADNGAGHASSSNEVLLRLLVADGSASDRATARTHLARMTSAGIDSYLRGKTASELLAVYTPMPHAGMIDMPTVFRDGVVLPADDPLRRLAAVDGYNQVPVIFGTTRDENKLFMQGDPQLVRRILWILPRIRDPRHYNLTAEYMAKMWKANGADEPAAAVRGTQPNVFVYRFDWDEEPRLLGTDLSELLGAAHGFEIPFVFGHFDLGREGNMIFTGENAPGRQTLSAQMMSYWAEFAYAGAPGRGRDRHLPEWTAWDDRTPASPKFMILDTPADGGLRMSAEALTATGVLAAVDADPRLPTQRDKCMIYRALAQWSRGFTKQDYPTAGRQGCKEYPIDAYPWE